MHTDSHAGHVTVLSADTARVCVCVCLVACQTEKSEGWMGGDVRAAGNAGDHTHICSHVTTGGREAWGGDEEGSGNHHTAETTKTHI